jgi:hypothetical protein
MSSRADQHNVEWVRDRGCQRPHSPPTASSVIVVVIRAHPSLGGPVFRRLGTWSYEHRRTIAILWLVTPIVMGGISDAIGTGHESMTDGVHLPACGALGLRLIEARSMDSAVNHLHWALR